MTYAELVEQQVASLLPKIATRPDAELAGQIGASFADSFSSAGLLGASNLDRIYSWLDSSLRQASETAGNAGRTVWQTLRDPESAEDVQRVALVVSFLATTFFPLREWPLEQLTALAILAVHFVSRKRT